MNLRATNSNTFEAHLFPDKKYTEKEFIFPKCELDSEYSTIQNQKLNWIELNKPLTLVHSNLTITKIKDLGLGKLTSKYQLHAKIVDYRPSISKWSTIEGISFSLLLYDGSGFLTIAVNNKDAEMFFNGKCCVEGIKSLGVAEDTVNGVEFDLCVEEFCHGGYVYYRMFNTVLN